ncbi:MAG TPA: hypothetical protein VLD39_07940, partial [Gammaproteobacteria bacterium]|nr:hypothetical protein [Gammaproteobacteria bacterium]
LPGIDRQFRELDSRIRLRREQHELLRRRLQDLLVTPRPDFLATADERLLSQQLDRIEQRLEGDSSSQAQALRMRAQRLRGLLTWTLQTEYHERLTAFASHLADLQAAIDIMTAQYESFVRSRQAAVHSYEGYDRQISRLRTRVGESLARVGRLMARQGHMLELVAVTELLVRRERLDDYRNQARFALADSYDRATKAQISRADE